MNRDRSIDLEPFAHDRYQAALNTQPGIRIAHPRCSGGSCRQGREKCSTPNACQLGEDWSARFDKEGRDLGRWMLIGFGVVLPCVVLAIHFGTKHWPLIAEKWAVAVHFLAVWMGL